MRARFFLHQVLILEHQLLWAFYMFRIDRYAIHRAHFYTLTGFEVPDAFGATGPVYLVDFGALKNRIIGALRLTYVAVDALVCNEKSHERTTAAA